MMLKGGEGKAEWRGGGLLGVSPGCKQGMYVLYLNNYTDYTIPDFA